MIAAPGGGVEAEMIALAAARRLRDPAFEARIEEMAATLATGLSRYCGGSVSVEVEGTMPSLWDDLLAASAAAGEARWALLPGGACLRLSEALLARILQRSLRDMDAAADDGPGTRSATGRRIALRVFEVVGAALPTALRPSGAQPLRPLPPGERPDAATRHPVATRLAIDGIADGLLLITSARSTPTAPPRPGPCPDHLPAPLDEATVPLRVMLRCGETPLQRTLSWHPGTRLDLAIDPEGPVDLVCGGRTLFEGLVGHRGGTTLAARIVRASTPETTP